MHTAEHPLHRNTDLHQKDLRIMPQFLQILRSGIEVIPEADTFLALSLIVEIWVSDGSIMARRVDISVIRPCQIMDYSQFLRISGI